MHFTPIVDDDEILDDVFEHLDPFTRHRIIDVPEVHRLHHIFRIMEFLDFEKFFAVEGEFWNQISTSFANWKWLRLNGTEADDIIATVTKNEPNKEIICISTDKDFQQLYRRKNFRQYNAVKRDWMDCMNPDIALQIKVLTGDSSDNIPPVRKGIGIKTAQKMINNGTVDLFLSDPTINENYVRNKALIDMDMIPEDIQQGIMENYNLASGNFDGRCGSLLRHPS